MKILAICGGMREESNTNKLVKKVAESSGCDYELVDMGKIEVKPCTGCSECMMNEGKCPIEDDMQGLYGKLMEADAIILGSPTYYMNVSGAVKCLIDRSLALYYRGVGPQYDPDMPFMGQRPLAGKPGVVCDHGGRSGSRESHGDSFPLHWGVPRIDLVEQLAEPIGMNDVADMPEVIKRAEEAGKKLGSALRK